MRRSPRSRTRFAVVASVGPASFSSVGDLVDAGATGLRLNASHLRGESLEAALDRVLAVAPPSRVVVDLQGAKMRVGAMRPRAVGAGESVVFALDPARGEVPLPHPELYRAAAKGDTLSADEGRLRFEVRDAAEGRLVARALVAGTLKPRKGINVLEHPVRLVDLGPDDCDAVRRAVGRGVRRFALSFVRDGREAELVRREAPGARVAGKVERAEAVAAFGALARRVDEVWICRGDLGAQMGAAAMAAFVAAVRPSPGGTPVLMAGQVLQGLVGGSEPSRSEVCHLYDLVERGYAGIVLSDETAIGRDPVRAVRCAVELVAALGRARRR